MQSWVFVPHPDLEPPSPTPSIRILNYSLFHDVHQSFCIMDTQSTVGVLGTTQQSVLLALLDVWLALSPADLTSSLLPFSLPCVVSVCTVALALLLAAYRLSPFHPLASIPGPTFARASGWYRAYHDIWRSGNMPKELQRLHRIYGKY